MKRLAIGTVWTAITLGSPVVAFGVVVSVAANGGHSLLVGGLLGAVGALAVAEIVGALYIVGVLLERPG